MNLNKKTLHCKPFKILLVSMPWALFNRPSIQLGTLKAYIENRSKDFLVDTSHPYLEVAAMMGPDLYHWISQNPWVSEALYAPQVFPEQAAAAELLTKKYVRKADKKIKRSFDYSFLTARLEEQLITWVKSYDWSEYAIVGFSVCFHQLFASLAAARKIKEIHPQVTVVFGGSACGADAGLSLVNVFHFIDYTVTGEGENGLLDLCAIISGTGDQTLPDNITRRKTQGQKTLQQKNMAGHLQIPSLQDLPVPDYSGYFSDQEKWFPQAPFIPVLPVEFSRGCWWNKCSFCNLNLQWCGYRSKKAAKMIHEIKTLAARHRCLDFTFVDNMLPPKEAVHFFKMTGADQTDFNFFAEIRAATGEKPLADIFSTYRRGGLSVIQVGIEAFSSSLLKKMRKGISAIENVAIMRGAQENALVLEGNIILQFPGSSQAEVTETLAVLDYVFPYRPLATASFFLGLDSPIHKEPQKYGIRSIVNHANNSKLFPKALLAKIDLLVKDYRGDRIYQQKIWEPVLQKIKKWQQYHAERNQGALQKPLLYYRDGGDFIIIRQELLNGRILYHRLKGASRQIYLYCSQIRSEKELLEKFPTLPPATIFSFLADLDKKRILFSENNKYLALAVHFRD